MPDAALLAALAGPLEAASDALTRLDERLRTSPVAAGFIARAHFGDACAALWLEGDLVHLEDLVLHDARMDLHAPTHALIRAATILRARRTIFEQSAWALTADGLATLRRGVGRSEEPADEEDQDADEIASFDEQADESEFAAVDALLMRSRRAVETARASKPERPSLLYDDDWDEEARLADWQAAVAGTKGLPALLAAAVALDAWMAIEPLQHQAWLGRPLAAAMLRARGKTRHHLVAVSVGLKAARYRRAAGHDLATRVGGLLEAVEGAAALGIKDVERLTLARELMLRKCEGRRGNSRLAQLVELFVRSPLVSVPMAAKELRVSAQAVEGMLTELGGTRPRELTGRERYRAWGVV